MGRLTVQERFTRHWLSHQMRSSKARFCFFFALPFVLGLFFFNASSCSFPFLIRPLVLSSLVLQRLQIYPEPLKVVRSFSVLQRTTIPRQSSHRRYLPSGINQLNAQLLEASLSLKPILLSFLCFPILFPSVRRVRGEEAIRLIYRLLIQLAFLPSVYTGHPRSFSPSSLMTLRAFHVALRLRFRATSESDVLSATIRFMCIMDKKIANCG